jgi:bifunctional N-acetylglucosamine-1-phosphate-uridyltransferase/glucosamine-1-phosphate-acetyltransferase GlmU-like protein
MKIMLKRIINSIFLIMSYPFYLLYTMLGRWVGKDSLFWSVSQLLSLVPGSIGSYSRKSFYRLSMTQCDTDCAILFGTIFSQVDTEIGKGVYIGPNCNIGRCRIEPYCTLGSNVHIMSGKEQHNFGDIDVPVQEQGGGFKKVVVGEDTWIGNCALIMANVGKKCIVGAGAVVTKDLEAYSIAVGNPAKIIKKRI